MENIEKEVSEEKSTNFSINSLNIGQNSIQKALHRNIIASHQKTEGINGQIFE